MIGAASIATMLFYNQVLGVSPGLCGTVFLIASIVDAISDPLVGAWSDRFRSRWGRRHPFMLFSVAPLTLGFYLMYAPPDGLSELQYFWWFLGTMTILRLGKTFYAIPHDALGAELTDDYHERTSVFGYNSVIGMSSGILLTVFVLDGHLPDRRRLPERSAEPHPLSGPRQRGGGVDLPDPADLRRTARATRSRSCIGRTASGCRRARTGGTSAAC